MEIANGPKFWRSTLLKVGVSFLALALLSWVGLIVTTSHEQASTPGEKNLGVAALFIMWGLPTLFFLASGVCVLFVHLALSSYRRFSRPKSLQKD